MNFLTIAGNLGRDAEVRHLNNGDPVASFSVGESAAKTSRRFGGTARCLASAPKHSRRTWPKARRSRYAER